MWIMYFRINEIPIYRGERNVGERMAKLQSIVFSIGLMLLGHKFGI